MKIRKQTIIYSVLIVLAIGVVFLWRISIPPMPHTLSMSQDASWWQSVVVYKDQYLRKPLDDSAAFVSYQSKWVSFYGTGPIPIWGENTWDFSDGQWFVSHSWEEPLLINIGGRKAILNNRGTIYFDVKSGWVFNFDTELTLDDSPLPVLFRDQKNIRGFVDMEDIASLIPPDLWNMYRYLYRQDVEDIAINITAIITDVELWLAREPLAQEWRDTSTRLLLSELQGYLVNISRNTPCWLSLESCVTQILSTLHSGRDKDPLIFDDLARKIDLWQQTSSISSNMFWEDIFRTYHRNFIFEDPQSRALRDKSVLSWLNSIQTSPDPDIWEYLTAVFVHEKLGSIYSIKLMGEMIRIGDLLMQKNNDTEIRSQTQDALTQLHTLLESTYFTKRDQFFVLKEDLLSENWSILSGWELASDLRALIAKIDNSHLFDDLPDFETIRGQLVWFTCIFEKNAEYVRDIRVCRVIRKPSTS